jgi:hypothetical protein
MNRSKISLVGNQVQFLDFVSEEKVSDEAPVALETETA